MVRERGYGGGPDHFRHLVACHRPRRPAEAYLRLRSLAGEQAQVDWGHFGHMTIGRARRPLMAFVMVLSYSRQIFLRFFLGAHMENFLRGHAAAFEAWNGCARVLLYDNLRSAVLERQGDAIHFHPTLLEFSKTAPVPVIGLNYKDKRDDGLAWLDRFGNPYRMSLFDEAGRVGIDFGVYGVPETFVIDKRGVIRFKIIGPLTQATIEQRLRPLLKELDA